MTPRRADFIWCILYVFNSSTHIYVYSSINGTRQTLQRRSMHKLSKDSQVFSFFVCMFVFLLNLKPLINVTCNNLEVSSFCFYKCPDLYICLACFWECTIVKKIQDIFQCEYPSVMPWIPIQNKIKKNISWSPPDCHTATACAGIKRM